MLCQGDCHKAFSQDGTTMLESTPCDTGKAFDGVVQSEFTTYCCESSSELYCRTLSWGVEPNVAWGRSNMLRRISCLLLLSI